MQQEQQRGRADLTCAAAAAVTSPAACISRRSPSLYRVWYRTRASRSLAAAASSDAAPAAVDEATTASTRAVACAFIPCHRD